MSKVKWFAPSLVHGSTTLVTEGCVPLTYPPPHQHAAALRPRQSVESQLLLEEALSCLLQLTATTLVSRLVILRQYQRGANLSKINDAQPKCVEALTSSNHVQG